MTRMALRLDWLMLIALACLLSPAGAAQTTSTGNTSTSDSSNTAATAPEGIEAGGYNIQQTIDLGCRFTNVTGSDSMYNTLVNLQQGPRILDNSFTAHSMNHDGLLFDVLSFNSSGFGGDPSNFAELRMDKYKWYNFSYLFRRDQNFFDYDLFANPLNPPTSTPSLPIPFSPHTYQTRRRMQDFDLKVLPQSRVTFRLGYSRNRNEGSFFSTIHYGTEALLDQPANSTSDTYRMGVDFKLLPRTTISYDQFIEHDKLDTNYFDQFFPFLLRNGTPVDLGIVWDTGNRTPCGTPFVNGAANPNCNAFLQYARLQRARTMAPTEQLSVRSSYFKRVEFTARAGYTNAQLNTPFSELFRGDVTRTNIGQTTITGPAEANRTSAWADFGVTFDITDKFRIDDRFHYQIFNIPGIWNSLTTNFFFPTVPGSLISSICPASPTTCAAHAPGSDPDVINEPYIRFLGENRKQNEIQLQYDFTPRFGAHVGYRYTHRLVHNEFSDVATETFFPSLPNRGDCAGIPLNPDGSCTVVLPPDSEDNFFDINEHTGLFGVWARPTDQLRANFDVEAFTADNFVTRISPRHQQRYRLQTRYQPRPWANLAFSMNIWESSNGLSEINYQNHNRNFSFSADVAPKERYGISAAYNYDDSLQSANICFVETPAPTGAGDCAEDPGNELQLFSFYENHTHYGNVAVFFKPGKRVTANLGYSITSVSGNTLILNPQQPLGPLDFNYHQPTALVSVELHKNVTGNVAWNYYQYAEGSFVGPTAPRYFHANLATVYVGYKF